MLFVLVAFCVRIHACTPVCINFTEGLVLHKDVPMIGVHASGWAKPCSYVNSDLNNWATNRSLT